MEKQTTQEYEKAIAYIIDRIKEGSLQLGSKLPPERRIAEELGIGRNSIREAISILHGMGLIERVQGSGNYVSKHVGESIRQSLTVMLALGTITKEEIFEFRRVKAGKGIIDTCPFWDEDGKVYILDRSGSMGGCDRRIPGLD